MYRQQISPLPLSIRNVHPILCKMDYIERLQSMNDFFDIKEPDTNLTPLFLSLQYSIINPLLLILFKYICTHKHKKLTSFDDFNNDMIIIKSSYPNYYEELVNKIKRQIVNEEILKKIEFINV